MLRWAFIFLVIGLVAGLLGFTNVAGASVEIAKVLFYIFLVIFLVLLLAGLFVVGGYSSLRPAPRAPRFVEDLSHVPAEVQAEVLAGAALIIEDLPSTPETLDWVFVSPALAFGSFAPGERLGEYRLGDDIAVSPEDGGDISAPDYAMGFVDLIEAGDHHRAHVNLAH